MLASTLVFVLLAAAPPAAASEVAAGLSPAQAEALDRKLQAVLQGGRGARRAPLTVSEDELNSYLAYKLPGGMPPELSAVRLRFERDRLFGNAQVDLDRLKGKLPPFGPFNPLSLLSGRVPAAFRGRLPNAGGFATLELEELSLNSLPIPLALIEQAVTRSTRSAERPEGFDLHAPFRLPYGIQRVRLQPGRAVLEY